MVKELIYMPWTPLAERFSALPLILAGPILRRTEPHAVTVWLALKESSMVTLRIYTQDIAGTLIEQFSGTRHTVRLGDHLHLVAVTARASIHEEQLAWGGLYYYDLFFQQSSSEVHAPGPVANLGTPGVLNIDPSVADHLERLVYPGHPLPSFVLPAQDLNELRILHGSCRKPHGVGRDMLPVIDTMLAETAHSAASRPQQLFLTGDQIYADDVAAPLLAALTDAGTFLLAGNREETLPLVEEPARLLPPRERTGAVRNMAMLTTGRPESHLLSLAEFYAMYLFAWSDFLWPDDLPYSDSTASHQPAQHRSAQQSSLPVHEYAHELKQLAGFRSSLPKVRRALANIATYMICDDHDVTDDWFLDGEWCHKVLGNELGRRIVRNGLLAYALFQAWGNTPDQFDEPDGAALLEAIDDWRGDESERQADHIAALIGLPAPFDGKGTLSSSAQALRWHYTYSGPRFQVIVLDTRTHRFYLAPDAFPALLSHQAVETQVVAQSHEDAEVTFRVSATPVFGTGTIEAIQYWSRMLKKENDAFDPEAWELEHSAFQQFLEAVSAMQRVVILSGDVHYAFGSSVQYWDHCKKVTAKVVNYTSSALHNEGSYTQLAALARGYPAFLRMEGRMEGRRGEIPPVHFYGQDTPDEIGLVLHTILQEAGSRVYELWRAISELVGLSSRQGVATLPAKRGIEGTIDTFSLDSSYQMRYLQDRRYLLHAHSSHMSSAKAMAFQPSSGPQTERAHSLVYSVVKGTHLLEDEAGAAEHVLLHPQEWLGDREAGILIVGYANVGDISLRWLPEKKEAIQRLWWCHLDDAERPAPRTEYRDSLDLPPFEAAPPRP